MTGSGTKAPNVYLKFSLSKNKKARYTLTRNAMARWQNHVFRVYVKTKRDSDPILFASSSARQNLSEYASFHVLTLL